MAAQVPHHQQIGFVSTRFAGTDGVSLETEKWANVLQRLGHTCCYFSGQSDLPSDLSYVVPEAFFGHPDIADLQERAFTTYTRPPSTTQRIHELAQHLKEHLYAFIKQFEVDVLIVENALAIPMNLPLGLALTELLAETSLPTIAHHHDFFWERKRFLTNSVWDYLKKYSAEFTNTCISYSPCVVTA